MFNGYVNRQRLKEVVLHPRLLEREQNILSYYQSFHYPYLVIDSGTILF